jgi:hypothetical protein
MARMLAVVLALTVLGCEDAPEDVPEDAPEALTCVELVERLRAEMATTSRACDGDGDCLLVGAGVDRSGSYTCNLTIAFAPRCSGDSLAREAWVDNPVAAALSAQWYERCVPLGEDSGVPGWWDCAPGLARCVAGSCRTEERSCFDPPMAGASRRQETL